MRGKTTIKKDGTIITEVLDREGSDCKEVYKLTERVGKQVDEEVIGPDCDSVHEGIFTPTA
jgi:hypothetical protein